MKRSLSVILSTAMAVSMFSSVAFGAETNLTTQQKYDAMKALGIFEGTDGGAAGLDQNMTRAQFAKIVSLLKQLAPDVASSAVYNDLDGATWAAGVIGSGTKAGYFDGVAEHKFAPSGEVTVEQLAAVMVRVLKLNVDNNAAAAGASDWAKGYVKAALDEHLIPQQNNYNVPASRAALVEGTYVAYSKLATPVVTPPAVTANASVVLAKISAYQQLGVSQDLSVTVTDKTYGTPIANAEVTFVIDGRQTAGNENVTQKVNTDATGKAKISYTRAVAGADTISIYLTSNPAARATTTLWWNSSAKVFDVGTMTDLTQGNNTSRAYNFTAYDSTTGAPLQNARINVGFAEDMLPTFGLRSNGARVNGLPIAAGSESVQVTTDSNGRGQFTISGADVTLSPVLFIDNGDRILNPTEIRSFVAATTFNSSNGLITITPVNTTAYADLNSQRVYKVKVANPDGTPITNLAVNVGIKELLDATTANDPGTQIIWYDNSAVPNATAKDNAATAGTAVASPGIKLPTSIVPNANGEFTFAVYNNSTPGSAIAGRVATPIVWIDTVNDGALGAGEVVKEASALSYVAEYQGKGRLGTATGSVLSNTLNTETTLAYTALNEDAQPITASALRVGTQATFTVRNTSSNSVTITKVNGVAITPVIVTAGAASTVTGTFPDNGTAVTSNKVTISLVSATTSTADVTAQITGYDTTAADKVTTNWYIQNITPQTGITSAVAATLTTNATAGVMATAKTAGAAGNAITLALVGGTSTSLAVTVAAGAISVQLATDAGSVVTSTQNDVVAAINANTAASALITAALPTGDADGTTVAVVQGTTALATGADQAVTKVNNVSVNGTVVSVNKNGGTANGGSMVVLTTGGELVTLAYAPTGYNLRVIGSDVSEATFESKISANDVISYTVDTVGLAIFNIVTNN